MVNGHERKRRIHGAVDDRNVQLVNIGNDIPHMHCRPAHGVYTDAQSAEFIHLDDIAQVADVRYDKVMFLCGAGSQCTLERYPLHGLESIVQDLVGTLLHNVCNLRSSWSAMGWVVFEAAIFR